MMKSFYPIIFSITLLLPVAGFAQGFPIKSLQKINNTDGGLSSSPLDTTDMFGAGVEVIGDVDHDGIDDIAVGAYGDDDGGTDKGAVYILMLNADGSVKAQQKISETSGNGPVMVTGHIYFGTSVTALGDLNGDGNVDIAVGMSRGDDEGSTAEKGAVYILFLDTTGQVLEYQKISDNEGGGTGQIAVSDYFGTSVENIGDINGDGLPDLAVGAIGDNNGGADKGAVYILNLDYNGTAKNIQKISDTQGGFTGVLDNSDEFGRSVTSLGDLDGDGVSDIAVGSHLDDDGGTDRGAVWILFLNDTGTVKSHQKISDTSGVFTGVLDDDDHFGVSIVNLGDLNGDGIIDLGVGAEGDDDSVSDGGAMWILYLDTNGTVKQHDKLGCNDSLLISEVGSSEGFMSAISFFGDRDTNGVIDILVGAYNAKDTNNVATGEIYVLHLDSQVTNPPEVTYRFTPEFVCSVQKYSALAGEPLENELDASDRYGWAVADLGDLDGDGVSDIAVGAHLDDDGGSAKGAIYIQFLNTDGSIKSYQKISDTQGGLTESIYPGDAFGKAIANLGDLDGDGVIDIAVGAHGDNHGGSNRGAVWILFLDSNGTVKSEQRINDTYGGFPTDSLDDGDMFGWSVASLGDLDGDGIQDMAVGSYTDDDGATGKGAVWILFLDTNGTVKSYQKISDLYGGLPSGLLDIQDKFGSSIANLGDLDGDGVIDLAVGAAFDDDGASDGGAVYILFMTDSGYVKSTQKISEGVGGFDYQLYNFDHLGSSVSGGYDLNDDGINDLLVGASYLNDGGQTRGGVFILLMNTDRTVKGHKILSSTTGNLTEQIDNFDYFGASVSVIDYNSTTKKAKIAIGANADDDGSTDAGAVYLVEIKIDACDYTELLINTVPLLPDSIPFDLTINGETQSFTTGGVESWEIYEPDYVGLGVMSIIGTADYDSLDIIFDINKCSIEDIRLLVDTSDSGTKDTLSLDSNFFQVNNYQELILFSGDTSEYSSADTLLYALDLQGGLGFSPDGDENYDVLTVTGLNNISQFSITITDLSSTMVFTSTDKSDFWNGKYMNTGTLQPVGAYNYSMEINGITYTGQILVDY